MSTENYYEAKKDQNKLLAALPFEDFPLAIEQVAKVGTMGANKYSRHSWSQVPDKEQRYRDAFYRHLIEIHKGEKFDPESKLLHLSHALWNLMAMVQMECENSVTKIPYATAKNYVYVKDKGYVEK